MNRNVKDPQSQPIVSAYRRHASFLVILLFFVGASSYPGWASSARAMQPPPPGGISDSARQQIAALLAEKESRTPTQQKIDSNLLYAIKQNRGELIAAGIQSLETNVQVDAQSVTEVDISASVSDALLAKLKGLGARIVYANARFRSIRARVALDRIETIAGDQAVIFVQPKQQAITSDDGSPKVSGESDLPVTGRDIAVSPSLQSSLAPGFAERAAHVRSQLSAALPQLAGSGDPRSEGLITNKINTSEGDVTHRANTARSTFGVNGTGVKACVLSNGVDSLASLQASGDLPADVTVLPGQAGAGDEGSAMLEIVYDLAPGAKLYFAAAFTSITSFAQNILDLRAAGCDIIIDDVFYFAESPFQKGQSPSVRSTTNGGIVTEAVNTVTASGALYFSSAGNSGNLNDTQSGVWEGDFADGGAVGAPVSGSGKLHDFDPVGTTAFDTITANGGSFATLFWSDPLGGSANDYDLFILNSTGTTVVASSTNVQNGSQDPFEITSSFATVANNRIVVVQRTGAAQRYLHVNTNRGRLAFGTAGQTGGHATAVNGFGVAATPAPAGAGGPFPNPFNSSNKVELFSSDGPRQFFFNANSSAITPGNFLAGGGQVVQKPDITAADGVSCQAPGFNPFFGTSAAAPHAGAIAALMKSADHSLTATQVRNLLTSTAIDIEGAGVDRDSGAGILDAFAAVQAVGAAPHAFVAVDSFTATEGARSNGNSTVEPGESARVVIQVSNPSLASATNVSATLALAAPLTGVSIANPGPISLGTIAAGGSATNSTKPFIISLAPSVPCGSTIELTLTLTYGNGAGNSPQTFSHSITIGKPIMINTTLDTTAPPSGTGYTATTGTQTGRLTRDGIASACGSAKPNPGLLALTGLRQYDAFRFTNTSSSTSCVTVNLPTSSSAFHVVAYTSAGFNPADPSQNYLADSGQAGSPQSFSFDVPAGQQFTVVVHEVDSGGGVGQSYTLAVSGPGVTVCAAPPPQPASIAATAGTPQSAGIGSTFASPLKVTVRDASNNPVPDVIVTFTAPASGASGTFSGSGATASVATNSSGVATAPPFTANATAGTYTVTASASGVATPAAFNLTNTGGTLYLPLIRR